MSADPTPAELAAYAWIRQRVTKGYWAAVLFSSGMAVFFWLAFGPSHPWNAVTVTGATLVLGFGVAAPVMRRVPRHWFRVPAGERVLHRMLGVDIFRWLLERSGWERHVHKREFHATRAGLPGLEVGLRSNVCAHGTCFAIHIVLAALALVTGHRWGALWILLAGVPVHLYPVLLQRSIRLRLQPLLDKSGPDISLTDQLQASGR